MRSRMHMHMHLHLHLQMHLQMHTRMLMHMPAPQPLLRVCVPAAACVRPVTTQWCVPLVSDRLGKL